MGDLLKLAAFVACSSLLLGITTGQSLQAPAPVSAPAGVCVDGKAAGELTVSGTGTVSVTSDVATVRKRDRKLPQPTASASL